MTSHVHSLLQLLVGAETLLHHSHDLLLRIASESILKLLQLLQHLRRDSAVVTSHYGLLHLVEYAVRHCSIPPVFELKSLACC